MKSEMGVQDNAAKLRMEGHNGARYIALRCVTKM
jgi:hypothetical protein